MKLFALLLLFLLFFNACSSKNAFYNFKMSKTQELSEDSMMSSKIYKNDISDGLVAIVYLNNVLANQYKEHEYFYVYLYTKTKNDAIYFTLNKKKALKVQKLAVKNKFSDLLSLKAVWADYYLVEFAHENVTELHFMAKSAHFSSDSLEFQKNE